MLILDFHISCAWFGILVHGLRPLQPGMLFYALFLRFLIFKEFMMCMSDPYTAWHTLLFYSSYFMYGFWDVYIILFYSLAYSSVTSSAFHYMWILGHLCQTPLQALFCFASHS
jgi:hypothetical protein